MRFHIAVLILCALTLSSCFGADTPDGTRTVSKDGLSMIVPEAWTDMPEGELPPISDGQIVLALTSTEIAGGFANNLVVLSDRLLRATSSREYAVANNTLSTAEYTEYEKLSEETIAFPDDDESIVYVFEARYNRETPKKRFFQTAKVCDRYVYLATIGVALGTDGTERYIDLLASMECEASTDDE